MRAQDDQEAPVVIRWGWRIRAMGVAMAAMALFFGRFLLTRPWPDSPGSLVEPARMGLGCITLGFAAMAVWVLLLLRRDYLVADGTGLRVCDSWGSHVHVDWEDVRHMEPERGGKDP